MFLQIASFRKLLARLFYIRLCCENGMARAALCISTPLMSESEQNRVRLVAAIRKYYQRLVFQGCCLAHSA